MVEPDNKMGIRRIGTHNDILGECPLWDEQRQCLYWIDIRSPAIHRMDGATQAIQSWPMPSMVGSIALTRTSRLLVALTTHFALFDPENEELETYLTPPPMPEGHRFNDGRCDRQGRFWVGTMHNLTRAPEGVLYCLQGLELKAVLHGICIPNSLAFSPDGATMYFADSLKYSIEAYDCDAAQARVGRPRVLATTTAPGFPDGSTVDAEGFLWNAEFFASRIVRYAPDGRVDRIIPMPVDRPTCCAFGGPDLKTLFITTTRQNLSPQQCQEQPLAGSLLCLDADVAGLPESRFSLPNE
jgi:sugar lactone lactonase YvrE